jgi:hypothetical protein
MQFHQALQAAAVHRRMPKQQGSSSQHSLRSFRSQQHT